MYSKQEPPFAIQVEMTEGCNLMCNFCGIHGIRSKAGDYKFMAPITAAAIANGIKCAGWNSRIEFAMHGEPTLNTQYTRIVQAFRVALPHSQLMMTTNGAGLLKGELNNNIRALFEAGLNLLAIDDYSFSKAATVIRERIDHVLNVCDYPKDGLNLSPHRRWPPRTKQVIFIEDLNAAKQGSHSKLTNHCGAAGKPTAEPVKQRCAKPFRELSVRWDGSVALCCNDWRGIYKIASAATDTTSLEHIWNGAAFTSARKKLYAADRNFGACKGCDYTTYRNGLLPDKLGRETMEPANDVDEHIIRMATSGFTLTNIVLRPWEK